MTYHLVFPEIYFQYKNINHQQHKKNILSKIGYNLNHKWNCNSKKLNISTNECVSIVSSSLEEFLKENEKSFSLLITESWLNLYEKGDYQEIHSHPKTQFALVYFVQYNKNNDGKFYFYNSSDKMLEMSGNRYLYNNEINEKVAGMYNYPDIDEGDVLIFPGYLEHGVCPHLGDTDRVTLTCNFNLR